MPSSSDQMIKSQLLWHRPTGPRAEAIRWPRSPLRGRCRGGEYSSRSVDDPYLTLGVTIDSDRRSIRSAYLAKARRHHPDLGGNVARMARLNAAYEVLGDPHERARFDALPERRHARRRAAEPWTGSAGAPPGRPFGAVLEFGVFAGWSLGEIARRDPGYLQWLLEHKEGRPFAGQIEAILGPLRRSAPKTQNGRRPR